MVRGNILVRYGYVPGIICCSSASGLLGMSTCSDWKFSLYVENSIVFHSKAFKFYPLPAPSKIQTQMVNNLIVTTPLQTIIDMIRYDCDIEYTCDSLDWWKRRYGNLDEMEKELISNNLYNKYTEEYKPFLEDAAKGWR